MSSKRRYSGTAWCHESEQPGAQRSDIAGLPGALETE